MNLLRFFPILLASIVLGSEHPGNVFTAGEDVRVPIPPTWKSWQAIDIDGKAVGESNSATGGIAALGKLPVGYFELREKGGTDRIIAGVVAKSTVSDDTPIALDAGMSWFYPDSPQLAEACTLCRLAGVKWVRDRGSWPELEPSRGTYAPESRYERSMRIQHDAGLKILQVNHASPPWANKNTSRFPEDLRDAYNFYKELAKRWHGLADSFEPWNEPDLDLFGGHTGSEIASFQKASYLGLKAGDPTLPVNQSVFAIDRPETLDDFAANDVAAYFDVYDLHHYKGLPQYPILYARHRALCAGKPIWTTEFNLTVHWADEKTKEPSDEQLRVQGYRVSKVFATALHEGVDKAFYFILGDYVERNIQYGLVHKDLTPRPAYVAFAAVGRLLNAARPIGRVDLGDEKLKAYAFATDIDGASRETIVAWGETKATTVEINGIDAIYDYLGRQQSLAKEIKLTRAPLLLVFRAGGTKSLKLTPPPAMPPLQKTGDPCPVVLQLIGKSNSAHSAFEVNGPDELRLAAYNFGTKAVRAKLTLVGVGEASDEVELAPGDRVVRVLRPTVPGNVVVRADCGDIGRAIVAGRVIATPTTKPAP